MFRWTQGRVGEMTDERSDHDSGDDEQSDEVKRGWGHQRDADDTKNTVTTRRRGTVPFTFRTALKSVSKRTWTGPKRKVSRSWRRRSCGQLIKQFLKRHVKPQNRISRELGHKPSQPRAQRRQAQWWSNQEEREGCRSWVFEWRLQWGRQPTVRKHKNQCGVMKSRLSPSPTLYRIHCSRHVQRVRCVRERWKGPEHRGEGWVGRRRRPQQSPQFPRRPRQSLPVPLMQPVQIVEKALGLLKTIIEKELGRSCVEKPERVLGRRSHCRLVDHREEGTSAGWATTEGTQAAEGAELAGKIDEMESRVRWRFPATSCEEQWFLVYRSGEAHSDGVSPVQGSLQVWSHGVPWYGGQSRHGECHEEVVISCSMISQTQCTQQDRGDARCGGTPCSHSPKQRTGADSPDTKSLEAQQSQFIDEDIEIPVSTQRQPKFRRSWRFFSCSTLSRRSISLQKLRRQRRSRRYIPTRGHCVHADKFQQSNFDSEQWGCFRVRFQQCDRVVNTPAVQSTASIVSLEDCWDHSRCAETVPVIQKIQKIVELPQILSMDEVVVMPVAMKGKCVRLRRARRPGSCHGCSTLSSSSPNPDLLSTHPSIHCEGPRQDGTSTEFHSSTRYDTKRIELGRNLVNPLNQVIDNQDVVEEVGVKPLSCSQSLTHSAYASAASIATPPDSDLEDEQLRKMLASPLYLREREEDEGQARAYHSKRESLVVHSSRNLEVSGKPTRSVYRSEKQMHNEHKLITQDEKAWCQVPLEILKLQGNLMQCFHATVNRVRTRFPKETGVTNRETVSRVVFILFLDLLTRQMLGNHFLMGNKDHLLNQARSELVKQKHQVGSLDSCINELQHQAYAQTLVVQDALHGILNLDENKFDYKKNYLWRKKRSEILKSEVCTKWKKWRELKNYESTTSLYKNWESHETIARTDEFFEWFRRISRSGIESEWEIVLRSQSTSSDSKFSFSA